MTAVAEHDHFGDLRPIIVDDLAAFVRDQDRHRSLTVVLEDGQRDIIAETKRWLADLRLDEGAVDACTAMRRVVERWADGSRDGQLRGVLGVVRLDERGHHGLAAALDELWQVRAKDDRDFHRVLEWARRRVISDPSPPGDVGCRCDSATLTPISIGDVQVPGPEATTLEDAHQVFRRWLGDTYDLDGLDAVLCALAAERLDGDPLWLLLLSGSGNAKTETVQAAAGAGAIVTSTISSEGALLSATSSKERAKDATGGLLRKFDHTGGRGVLVIKDVTSILSMNRDARASVLGAIREIHDGAWSRNVGSDGGKTLEWAGRLVVIGAVTTAWDRAHDVIAAMGDRFVTLRMDSSTGRLEAGRQAIGNTGSETEMRAELAAAVAGVVARVDPTRPPVISEEETERLLAAADLVTLARTGVDYDYRGDVIDAHAPEMPTRFAKELAQLMRGGIALGMDRVTALNLALRAARDSMPPLRLAIIRDLASHPGSRTRDIRQRLGKPRATVDRQLQALHILGVIDVDEEEDPQGRAIWRYSPAAGVDLTALDAVPDLSVGAHTSDPLLFPHNPRCGDKSGTGRTGRPGTEPPPSAAASSPKPACAQCGSELLLVRSGRDTCARCAKTQSGDPAA